MIVVMRALMMIIIMVTFTIMSWWWWSDEGRCRWSRSLLLVIFAVIGWVSWPNSKCHSDNDKNRLMWRDNRVRDQREMDRLTPLHRWFCWCYWCRCWWWCWCPCRWWCCWCTTGIKHTENFVMQPLLWRCQLQADRRGWSFDLDGILKAWPEMLVLTEYWWHRCGCLPSTCTTWRRSRIGETFVQTDL